MEMTPALISQWVINELLGTGAAGRAVTVSRCHPRPKLGPWHWAVPGGHRDWQRAPGGHNLPGFGTGTRPEPAVSPAQPQPSLPAASVSPVDLKLLFQHFTSIFGLISPNPAAFHSHGGVLGLQHPRHPLCPWG